MKTQTSNGILLDVNNIEVVYNDIVQVLRGVSLSVAEGAIVKDSIIMDNTEIGRNSVIDRCILDKEVIIGSNSQIGYGDDYRINRLNAKVLNTGLTIIGKRTIIPADYKIGRNCIIYDNTLESDLPESEIESGETIKPRRRRNRINA